MKRSTEIKPETAIVCTLPLSNETFYGTPVEIVTAMRATARMFFADNVEYMRGWADRAALLTKRTIETASEAEFVASNIEAGLIKRLDTEEIQ